MDWIDVTARQMEQRLAGETLAVRDALRAAGRWEQTARRLGADDAD